MKRTARWLSGALVAVAASGCAAAGSSGSQLDFGVDMARRGLWNEAVFRFEQARQARPADVKVLNNLAVAYEAVGRFDDALATYREAVRLAPAHPEVKANYSRFLEFYQSYKPQPPAQPAAGEEPRP